MTPPAPSGFAEIWVNSDLQPIDQPTAIGSAIVGLVARDGFLFLIGIDPASGHVRWAKNATVPPMTTRGERAHVVAIGGDKVAYFRVVRNPDIYYHWQRWHQLVVADASTGKELASSPPAEFYSWPYACANGKDACVISHGERARQEHEYRLEVTSDSFIAAGDSLPYATRVLSSPGLLDLADRPGNTLGWLSHGKLLWRRAIDTVFPRGFTSDAGWAWRLYPDQRVVVGSVYAAYPPSEERTFPRDLATTTATAGLAEATGEVMWRDAGSDAACIGNIAPVRCRYRGIATIRRDGVDSFDNAEVTVEGFDPATGASTWTVPMAASTMLVDYGKAPAVAGPAQIAVDSASGWMVLDYAAGTASPAAPGSTFWCMSRTRYQLADGRGARRGGVLAAICDHRGQPSTVLPSPEATMAAGAHTADHAVIATQTGYLGFRLR